jgi:NAD(P)-dependent dehydrogenase (short-subunit alcohol dehydrogenase family)
VLASVFSANHAIYNISKAGVAMMTQALAKVTVKTFKKFFVHFVQCVLFLTLTQFVL